MKQKFIRHNERFLEYAFLFNCLKDIYPVSVLDIGTGQTSLPALLSTCGSVVTAIDQKSKNRHWKVIKDDILKPKLKEQFDFVSCISVLEHIEQFNLAAQNIFKLVKPGGYVVLTFPFSKEYHYNVYDLEGSAYRSDLYITQSFNYANLYHWLRVNEARIIKESLWNFWTGHAWTVGKQIIPPEPNMDNYQLGCFLLRKK